MEIARYGKLYVWGVAIASQFFLTESVIGQGVLYFFPSRKLWICLAVETK